MTGHLELWVLGLLALGLIPIVPEIGLPPGLILFTVRSVYAERRQPRTIPLAM